MQAYSEITQQLLQSLLRQPRDRQQLDDGGARFEVRSSHDETVLAPASGLPWMEMLIALAGILGIGQLIAWGGAWTIAGSSGSSLRPGQWVTLASSASLVTALAVMLLLVHQRRRHQGSGPLLVFDEANALVTLPRQSAALNSDSIRAIAVFSGWIPCGANRQYATALCLRVQRELETQLVIVSISCSWSRPARQLASQIAKPLNVSVEELSW